MGKSQFCTAMLNADGPTYNSSSEELTSQGNKWINKQKYYHSHKNNNEKNPPFLPPRMFY